MKGKEELVEELLDENDEDELVRLTEMAKDPKVVDIRRQFKERQYLTPKQAAVLAGWIADERLEYGEEDEE